MIGDDHIGQTRNRELALLHRLRYVTCKAVHVFDCQPSRKRLYEFMNAPNYNSYTVTKGLYPFYGSVCWPAAPGKSGPG